MAISTINDFVIYNEEFQTGKWEATVQFLDAFNGASRNAIRLITQALKGEYEKEAFFQQIAGVISRRDPTSTSAATSLKLEQEELIGVKINRKFGPVDSTLDAFRKIASNESAFSFMLGQIFGHEKMVDLLNTGIMAVEAAIQGQSNLIYDATGLTTKTLTTTHLVSGLNLFGDMAERIIAWVMHSKPYNDLLKNQIAGKITNVADRVIHEALPGTLNRPIIVTDSPSLINVVSGETTTYNVLGLVVDAVTVSESEAPDEIVIEKVTGLENLVMRMQGEYAFNLKCKGFQWDINSGGANPTDSAIATTTNWDKIVTADKDLSGVRILVQ